MALATGHLKHMDLALLRAIFLSLIWLICTNAGNCAIYKSQQISASGFHYTVFDRADSAIEFCVTRPDKNDPKGLLCIPAAFTTPKQRILGMAICNGQLAGDISGSQMGGAAVFVDGDFDIFASDHGKMLTKDFVIELQKAKGSLFQQFMLVKDGVAESFKDPTICQRRALIVFKNGKKAVIESREDINLNQFAKDLADLGVLEALYTDMGSWDEGWYRNDGKVLTLGKICTETDRQTNWILFKSSDKPQPFDYDPAGAWLQKHATVPQDTGKDDPKSLQKAILYGKFPLPRLSGGVDIISLWRGRYKGDLGDVCVQKVATGTIDGEPAAVTYTTWSTGGTGVWEVLTLYRKKAGKLEAVGQYDLEDRSAFTSLAISDNAVVLNWIKHAPNDSASTPSVPTVTKLFAKDFHPPG